MYFWDFLRKYSTLINFIRLFWDFGDFIQITDFGMFEYLFWTLEILLGELIFRQMIFGQRRVDCVMFCTIEQATVTVSFDQPSSKIICISLMS